MVYGRIDRATGISTAMATVSLTAACRSRMYRLFQCRHTKPLIGVGDGQRRPLSAVLRRHFQIAVQPVKGSLKLTPAHNGTRRTLSAMADIQHLQAALVIEYQISVLQAAVTKCSKNSTKPMVSSRFFTPASGAVLCVAGPHFSAGQFPYTSRSQC